MKTKIYIAGKITGDPDYKAKFKAAADAYKKEGYIVLNPSWMPQGMQPADYMRICFAMIDTADVVAFLPGYELSSGAQLELQYCFYTDKATKLPPDKGINDHGPCGMPAAASMTMPMAVSPVNTVKIDPADAIKKALTDSLNKQLNVGFCGGVKP